MSPDQLLVVALLGFLVAGILVATLVAVIDNLFIYKRRSRRRQDGAPPDDSGQSQTRSAK
jgi:hypothetical protein